MMSAIITLVLLVVSNVFMTFAWYGHLKLQSTGISANWPLYAVILFSWGIALLEYCCQVPANRIGFEGNAVNTLVVFVIFSLWAFEGFQLRWNHILAFFMLIGAVYLIFMK